MTQNPQTPRQGERITNAAQEQRPERLQSSSRSATKRLDLSEFTLSKQLTFFAELCQIYFSASRELLLNVDVQIAIGAEKPRRRAVKHREGIGAVSEFYSVAGPVSD